MSEKRLLITAKEIKGFEFECPRCQSSMMIAAGTAFPAGFQCAACNQPIGTDQTVFNMISAFMDGINAARNVDIQSVNVKLVVPVD